MKFDLTQVDTLLATTRTVRKRLDLERPVPREILLECIELATQAPTGSNAQSWRWMVVEDADKRKAIADIYRKAGRQYLVDAIPAAESRGEAQTKRVYESALWLADNLERVPVFVIPCVAERLPADAPNVQITSMYGSIFPAVWSFQLALRSRGLGSALTTLHLFDEQQVAKLLGIPEDVMQIALLPVGYTKGTDFKPAARPPTSTITHWNKW
jgi:nitroreductase